MLDVQNGKLILTEFWGGTRGSEYYYIVMEDKLVHISRLVKGKEEFVTRRGRRKVFVYEMSISELCRDKKIVELIEFSFTNKGYGPYAYKYLINCTEKIEKRGDIKSLNIDIKEVVKNYKIVPVRERVIYELLNYDKYVIPMINEIKNTSKKLGFELLITGYAVRLEDTLSDPEVGRFTALVLPTWQARQKLLENLVKMIHEIYVMTLIPHALNAKTIYHQGPNGKLYWEIEYASRTSTAIIETPNGKRYTIWYQFSLKDWWDVVFPNWYAAMMGSGEKVPRQFIRPDIMVFEGEYKYRDQLIASPPKRAWLIEAKTKFTESDLEQLENYIKNFESIASEKLHLLLVGLENVPYKRYLEIKGYKIFEHVYPDGIGVKEFVSYIRNTM